MEQQREDRFVIVRFDVLQSKDLTPSEKLVYARICSFKEYFESKEDCAEILGVSKDTVVKAKQKLLRLGYIKEMENTGRGKIYQAVYDEQGRVVKSTNQSGKKHPIRMVNFTTIVERENKVENNIRQVDVVSSDELTSLMESIKGILETPRARVTPGRLRKLKARLKAFNGEEIERAARNLAKSSWHMGDNPQKVKYADVDFLLRSDEQVDKWLNYQAKEILFI